MRIAILVAMTMEAKKLIARIENPVPTKAAGKKFLCGSIGGAEVVLHICGAGMRKAANGAKALIEKYHPDILLNYGVSGGFVPGIALCDTVIARSSYPASAKNGTAEMTDEALADFALRILPHAQIAPAATSIGLILNKRRKARIAQKSGAVCVDMETYAVAKAANALHTPLLVIRCMSDTVEPESLLHFFKNGAMAAEKVAAETELVIRKLAEEPS